MRRVVVKCLLPFRQSCRCGTDKARRFVPATCAAIYSQNKHYSNKASDSPLNDAHSFLQTFYVSQRHGVLSIESGCKQFCHLYRHLELDEKLRLLCHIGENYGADQEAIVTVARKVVDFQARGEALMLRAEERLRGALTARYQLLFSDIGRIEGGVKFLVDMRADIKTLLSDVTDELQRAHLQTLQHALKELLSLWFTVGFLTLQRITWQSPCDMLQKISEYEAVHPVRHWADIKRRVGPYRRCYVFTHNSMPAEPIVVLHTALTNEISSSIHSIIGPVGKSPGKGEPVKGESGTNDDVIEDPEKISTAMFYSITSTQKGLQGVDLGNYLIKKVVGELQHEWPQMTQFSSVSPIPGFRDWLLSEISRELTDTDTRQHSGRSPLLTKAEVKVLCNRKSVKADYRAADSDLQDVVTKHSWTGNSDGAMVLKPILMRLCVRYLYHEKRRGYALDSVANFHLQNGAVMWRVNWQADMTLRGLNNSCGIMVNYRYYLQDTVYNSQQYIENNIIQTSPQVKQLADSTNDIL